MGMNAKLYRQTGTSWAVPTFTEITEVQNINLNPDKTKVEGSTRASKWKWSKGALKDCSVEISMPKDDSSAFTRALLRSWLRGTAVELLVMDGVITTAGSEGIRGEFEVFGKPRTEEIEGLQVITYSLSLTYGNANKPQWYVCATKSTDSGSAIADGTDVYWDSTEEEVTTTASTNEYLGESVGASIDATAYMYYDADHDTP